MIYESYIDNLMEFYATEQFGAEAVEAKEEFFELAGIFDEQTSHFELKLAQFTDWYLFCRALKSQNMTPIKHFVTKWPMQLGQPEKKHYENLANSRLSLFEFLKFSKTDLHVRDWFSGYKLVIKNSPITTGFNKEEPFQARLIPHEDSFLFSPAFCFHPPEAVSFIKQEIKKVKKMKDEEQHVAREALVVRLFRMRHKFEQYRHVGVQEIYSNDSRLRI